MAKINLFIVLINLFIMSCIFDPFGRLFNLKDVALIGIFIFFLSKRKSLGINIDLIQFIMIFISIPLISVLIYYIREGAKPFEGIMLMRSYMLIILMIPLVCLKVDLFKILKNWINLLSFVIYFLLFIYVFFDNIFNYLVEFGARNGTMLLGVREFGQISVLELYYVTSPLICINVAHYAAKIFSYNNNIKLSIIMLAYNSFALFISGTRSNIIIALFMPITVFFFYTKSLKFRLFCILLSLAGLIFFVSQSIFFSSDENSNFIKIGLLYEYFDIFTDIPTIVFGQGLGAYHFWISKNKFDFVTELTYFDIFRYYGIILGPLMLYYLFIPLNIKYRYYNERGIIVGYYFFLFICAFNPLFFSSIGMLFYIALMSNVFIKKIYG